MGGSGPGPCGLRQKTPKKLLSLAARIMPSVFFLMGSSGVIDEFADVALQDWIRVCGCGTPRLDSSFRMWHSKTGFEFADVAPKDWIPSPSCFECSRQNRTQSLIYIKTLYTNIKTTLGSCRWLFCDAQGCGHDSYQQGCGHDYISTGLWP